jgi:hypothetical protein
LLGEVSSPVPVVKEHIEKAGNTTIKNFQESAVEMVYVYGLHLTHAMSIGTFVS